VGPEIKPSALLVSRAAVVTALALAGWPVARWYVARVSDGSDEPWGLAALAVAMVFAPRTGWWYNPNEGGRGYTIELAGTNLFMASPSKWQKFYDAAEGADAKAKSQAAWAAFAKDASGTGPWKMSSFTPRPSPRTRSRSCSTRRARRRTRYRAVR